MDRRSRQYQRNKNYKKHQIISIFAVIVVASFIGFVIENTFLAVKFGYVDNRGMVFPFLFGYGAAIVGIYLIFGLPSDPLFFGHPLKNTKNKDLKYILAIMISVCVGEASLGYLVEYTTGMQWWSYNDIPFHIGQYTSIPTSVGFALIIYLFMKNAYTPICEFAVKMEAHHHAKIIIVLLIIIIIDFFFSMNYVAKHGYMIEVWHREVDTTTIKSLENVPNNIINQIKDILPKQ